MFNLGFYISHNGGFALQRDGVILEVVELERLISVKNAGFLFYNELENPDVIELIIDEVITYFADKYGVQMYEQVAYQSSWHQAYGIIPAKKFTHVKHHEAHAWGGLYQSPFDEALVISCDGGSDQGVFNIFNVSKLDRSLEPLHSSRLDLCVAYMTLGHFTSKITREVIRVGNLVYPGKLMGLAAYGKVRPELVEKLTAFYRTCEVDNFAHLGDTIRRFATITGHPGALCTNDGDWAASNQHVFETLFMEVVEPYLSEKPIIMTGGAALNILNNTKLLQQYQVFVGPVPNDCGLAIGLACALEAPPSRVDPTYIGSPVWDRRDLARHLYERHATRLKLDELAHKLITGQLIGVVRGRSEHGARALGNRSIIASPIFPKIKDELNEKVKRREWYRPFAPVVRLEDVDRYFEAPKGFESRWMSFCFKVKDARLKGITHEDGTARVQTVTHEQNPFLYELLGKLIEEGHPGVLLNTSFNVAGKPILNTYAEALQVFDSTGLDALVFEDYVVSK